VQAWSQRGRSGPTMPAYGDSLSDRPA